MGVFLLVHGWSNSLKCYQHLMGNTLLVFPPLWICCSLGDIYGRKTAALFSLYNLQLFILLEVFREKKNKEEKQHQYDHLWFLKICINEKNSFELSDYSQVIFSSLNFQSFVQPHLKYFKREVFLWISFLRLLHRLVHGISFNHIFWGIFYITLVFSLTTSKPSLPQTPHFLCIIYFEVLLE